MKLPISYRPDIDGMRAIAVLLVILFHANFSLFSGGYIGVDVFFVLSGYLITLTIDKEMSENRFSFQQFYLRRIRRIIPVLVFIMLIVTIPAYLILFADNLESYGRTLLHTILSTNNFHLWVILKDYFAENSDLIPFLHTWSLSVEEQFYFVWPVLLLVLHKFLTTKNRLLFIVLFVIAMLVLSIYLTKTNMNMAYFLLPARFFELGMGACLAMYWDKLPTFAKQYNGFISIIGMVLIVLPAVMLTKGSAFPGLNAFWPCLGTCLLIYTGKTTENQGILNTILQNKLLVWVGLLSYSLYLWHWPIFTFIKYLGVNLEGTIRIGAILLTFVLSYLSWKYVEQPFRIKYKFDFKRTMLYVFVPSLVLIAAIYGILDAKDGFPNRFPNLAEFNPKANYPNKVRQNCFDQFKIGNCDECFLGVKKEKLDGMLIGDSFGNHTAAFLDILAKDAGLYLHDSTAGGYPVLNKLDENGNPVFPPEYAINRLQYAKQFDTIYIAANWDEQGTSNSPNYLSIVKTVGELIKLGKKVVIFDCLRASTELNLHKAKLVKSGNMVFFKDTDFRIPMYERPNDYIVYVMKQKFPELIVIDLNDAMCKDGKCDIQLDNTIVYRNFNHLNTSGAEMMAKKYIELKGNPLKK
ncbi:acyltransferase [Flavobacterium amnicola]|uniref:Acyltransferase n=1 Tax=Flavobacterium amnicola TaxID=2506422 RepID=A0A4Q1K2P9_9FLAO|nr:acyltransferase family protein [Flavobacterium amnicola]RXR19074.1 acyltransferase [Flavobacterium amnicola]